MGWLEVLFELVAASRGSRLHSRSREQVITRSCSSVISSIPVDRRATPSRSSEAGRVPLSGDLAIVVGENNTGKSNLIDACRLLFEAEAGPRAGASPGLHLSVTRCSSHCYRSAGSLVGLAGGAV